MPSGMDRNSANCICPILLTYLCVDFKELPDASASKVFSPDKASASVKLFLVVGLVLPSLESCSSSNMVGVTGFEPVTLRLSSACSNQLSYTPIWNPRLPSAGNPKFEAGGAEETRTPDL